MEPDRIAAAVEMLEAEVRTIDADRVDPGLAHCLIGLFARAERVGTAGTALLARRVANPAALARETGTAVGKARSMVDLSRRLRDTPDLDEAVRGGRLSLDQATEIARAETAAPAAPPPSSKPLRRSRSMSCAARPARRSSPTTGSPSTTDNTRHAAPPTGSLGWG